MSGVSSLVDDSLVDVVNTTIDADDPDVYVVGENVSAVTEVANITCIDVINNTLNSEFGVYEGEPSSTSGGESSSESSSESR